MNDRSVVIYRTALAGLLVGFFAVPAYAGFEWTPPPPAPVVTAAPEPTPDVPAAPAAVVEANELTPVPAMSEFEAAAEPVIEPVVESVAEEVAAPATIQKESNTLPPSPFAEVLDAPGSSGGPYTNVVGFGSDIPLALAMGQIVPPSFAYSFAPSVSPGLKVSWNGGKPWNEVLNDSLQPHGLHAEIVGQAVVVRSDSSSAVTVPVSEETPTLAADDFSAQSQEVMMMEQAKMSAAEPVLESAVEPVSEPVTLSKASDEPAPEPAVQQLSMRGEGTADNYPRRTPPTKNFRRSIFAPNEQKANDAPPPPPMVEDHAVIIENEVASSEMPPREDVAADQAAAFEPAAPAVATAMPQAEDDASAPVPLTAQRISYADETMMDKADGLTDRAASRSVAVENNSSKTLDPFEVSFWRAEADQSLQDVLSEWAESAGVEVLWDSGYDYKLPTSISMHGTFPDAVSKVFSLYGTTEPRPQGRLHPNLPKGPSVLLVENYP